MAASLLAFGAAVAIFVKFAGPLASEAAAFLEVGAPETWLGWLWVGPLRALAWLLSGALVLASGVFLYLCLTLVSGILAAPFLDGLSLRVERIASGREPPAGPGGPRGALRAALEEARRAAFLLAGQLALFALGLVPGLQPLAAAGLVVFSALFLPLDYTGYALDRRAVPFRVRRRWIVRHARPMLGLGAAALATFAIPGLNFLCLPLLVTAGTLLALEVGPPSR